MIYDKEVKERWGNTDAYKEHCQKTSDYTQDKWQQVNDGLDNLFAEFAECKDSGNNSDSQQAIATVKAFQNYITNNYYTCTNEILSGLGQMYVTDERFTANIDKHSPGTALFISQAIKNYCK